MRRRAPTLRVALLAATFAVACGSGRPDRAARAQRDAQYAAAERAYGRGDLDEARALFEQVVADAVDPDARALAEYRLARIAARQGDVAAARARYAAVSAGPSQERGPLAAYQLALEALDAGDPAPMRALVEAHPDTVAADKAVRTLADRALQDRGADPGPVIEWLEAIASRHPRQGVADNALWWAADLRLRRQGDVAGVRRLLARLTRTWPESPLADESLWRLARLHQRQGQWVEAAATYQALSDLRDATSYLVGSYRSRYLDDALLARAEVLFHGLKDCAAAVDAYARLLDEFESTVLRDDALFGMAQAERCAGRDPAATLKRLQVEHPESRLLARIDAVVAPDPARLTPAPFAP